MILKPTSQRLLRAAGVVLAFIAGFLLTASITFLLKPLAPERATRRIYRAKRLWCRVLLRILGVRVRQQGQVMPSPGLVVSNHVSWLDIIVLGAQGDLNFVSKHEVAEWPVVGYLASHTGTLFLRRGNRDSSREILDAMTRRLLLGEYMVFFPEGTSTTGTSVLRFHNRLFQAALDAGVDVQAVSLSYREAATTVVPFVGDDEFLPHLWQVLALPDIPVDLSWCDPVPPENQDRKSLASLTHTQVSAAVTGRQCSE